jgi:hypothetical protein
MRAWPADGETSEPEAWLAAWDYAPAHVPRRGAVGLVAGVTGSDVECDYFLLKQARAPELTVRLPAAKPARPSLEPRGWSPGNGMALDLWGEALTRHAVERSFDFVAWDENLVVADDTGRFRFQDIGVTNAPRQYYRARILQ